MRLHSSRWYKRARGYIQSQRRYQRRYIEQLSQSVSSISRETNKEMTVILTSAQAKEKLSIGSTMLRNLVKGGHLKPVNEPVQGKRFHMRFDSRDVNLLSSKMRSGEVKVKHRIPLKPNGAVPHSAADGILSRMGRLETEMRELVSKIDKLLTIWS